MMREAGRDNTFTIRLKLREIFDGRNDEWETGITVCADEHIHKVKEGGYVEDVSPNITYWTSDKYNSSDYVESGHKVG